MSDYMLGLRLQQTGICSGKRNRLYQQQQQQYLCGHFIGWRRYSFFQKNIGYQHNMVAQVLIYHIELFYFEFAVGKYIIYP